MLKILKGQDDITKGLILLEENGNASSLPFVLHYLSAASTSNQKVLLVTSKLTETNYKLICSKAGIRWNPAQVSFIEFLRPFESFDVTADQMMEDVLRKVSDSCSSIVLFDDLSILEQFGATTVEVSVFVHEIYTQIKISSPTSALLVSPFSKPSGALDLLRARCHVYAEISPVGHGFGKDASIKVVLNIRSPLAAVSKKGILLSGERTISGTWMSVDQ